MADACVAKVPGRARSEMVPINPSYSNKGEGMVLRLGFRYDDEEKAWGVSPRE